jgi:hypothetical protein
LQNLSVCNLYYDLNAFICNPSDDCSSADMQVKFPHCSNDQDLCGLALAGCLLCTKVQYCEISSQIGRIPQCSSVQASCLACITKARRTLRNIHALRASLITDSISATVISLSRAEAVTPLSGSTPTLYSLSNCPACC